MIDYSQYIGENIFHLYELDADQFRQLLTTLRWDNIIICPFCSTGNSYITNRGFKCKNKNCYKKFTVFTNTIFENCKLFHLFFIILVDMLWFNYPSTHYSKEGICTQKTAWRIQKKLKTKFNWQIKEPIHQLEWLIKQK